MSTEAEHCSVQPTSTYGWLTHNPLTSAAGNAILSWYQSSKNYSRVANFVLDKAERSVKFAAETAAPLAKKLETPATMVDGFTLRQLQKLETKVPVITKPPDRLLADGKQVFYTGLQAGGDALGNTRAAQLIGSGVGRTLDATDQLIDYLLPAEETETELPADEPAENKNEQAPETKTTSISRKIKTRIYYRTLRRLQTGQQQCKSALDQLKANIDLLKYAVDARDAVAQKCSNVKGVVKSAENRVSKMWKGESKKAPLVVSSEEDEDIEWLTPRKKGNLEAAFDYAKQLGEVVYNRMQFVSNLTAYLPHQLKNGATQTFNHTRDLCTTLALAKSVGDLSSSAVNKMSQIVTQQANYIQQLGNYLTETLSTTRSKFSSSSGVKQVEQSQENAETNVEDQSDEEEELIDVGSGGREDEKDAEHDTSGGREDEDAEHDTSGGREDEKDAEHDT